MANKTSTKYGWRCKNLTQCWKKMKTEKLQASKDCHWNLEDKKSWRHNSPMRHDVYKQNLIEQWTKGCIPPRFLSSCNCVHYTIWMILGHKKHRIYIFYLYTPLVEFSNEWSRRVAISVYCKSLHIWIEVSVAVKRMYVNNSNCDS